MMNDHIDNNSELIYSINQGYGDDLVSLNNLSRIYQTSDESVTTVMFVPGDIVYYTFVFRIKYSDYVNTKTMYDVSLVLRAEASEDATGDNGKYLEFLHDSMIEQNTVKFGVLRRGSEVIDGNEAVYYDVVKYSNNAGTYSIDNEGSIVTFDATTTGAQTLNTEVTSLCPNKQESGIGANFTITIPIVPTTSDIVFTDENSDEYLFFMLYIPIFYVDTGINQNNQMDSVLTINGSTILLRG